MHKNTIFVNPRNVKSSVSHQHVRGGVGARRLLLEPKEEAEFGAGRAEQKLRETPSVSVLGEVQQSSPI